MKLEQFTWFPSADFVVHLVTVPSYSLGSSALGLGLQFKKIHPACAKIYAAVSFCLPRSCCCAYR